MAPGLIGRDHPAGVLRAEIDRAADSHGGLVLVTGEAGIGKTTLVADAVEAARHGGALVLSGTCWDSDSAPGYWPWVQVIRGLRRGATPEQWEAVEAAADGVLAVLLGEATGDEPAESFRLYDAVTSALVTVSQRRPVLVVLEDLHWADPASIRLLEFAAQHTWFERLLLVGTYRDVEVDSTDHPLQPLLLPLVAKATTVTLTGLGRDEVRALMTRTVGHEPEEDLVAEVYRRTGGNPFFVEQTARLWHSGGSVSTIAPGVREAVRRRLSLLSAPVVDLLRTAAVLGREFHRQVLAGVAASPVAHADRLLDQAVAARLVTAKGAGQFAFAHDLVRETLHDAIDDADLRGRHAAVVRALDRSPALAERVLPADLARHAYLAGDELEPSGAADHLVAAAKDASGRLAIEEAIGHYRRALEVIGTGDPRRRALIALSLAQEIRHTGDRAGAWPFFDDAVAAAREVDDPAPLARVALSMHRNDEFDGRKGQRAAMLREAYTKLVGTEPDSGLSPGALAATLTKLVAVLARTGGDDDTLGFTLWTQHDAIWGPGTAAERETLTREMAEVARRTSDDEMEQYATSLRWVALVEQGDPGYLEQFHAFVAMTKQVGHSRMYFGSLMDQSIIAAMTGRFAESQELLDLSMSFPEQENEHDMFRFMGHHLRWSLLLLRGRFEELDELHRSLGDDDHPFPRLIEGITAAQRGDTDTAARCAAELSAGEPVHRSWAPLHLRLQAQVAAATGSPEARESARAQLVPYAGQWLVSLFGCDISGPVALWIAILDAAQERWTEAIDGFTAARRSADALHARPWSVEARAGLARSLLARDAPGDSEAGHALLDDVEREATELGMHHIAGLNKRMTSGVDSPSATPRVSANEFRFSGDVWTLSMDGRVVHAPDAKGLRDLHFLLSQPDTDIQAVDLLAPEGGEAVAAAGRMSGDVVLDDEAKAQYRRRLNALDEEIDRASERGDDARAAEFDREREALLTELRAAAGLGGRSRRLGDEAERARKTVTARIRDTLRKLDQRHPELAAHLRASVTTGLTCSYRPGRDVHWRL